MKIILISAKSQHGKDAAAALMKNQLEERGEKVLTIHFADPVKWFARDFYNWDGKKDKDGRALLQYIGTTMMRTYDQFYWGRIISEFVAAASNDFTYALIPDWRFFSEKTAIERYNDDVTTVRITRLNPDGSIYENPLMTYTQLTHISETELDNAFFDYCIINDGDINQLEEKVNKFITQLTSK